MGARAAVRDDGASRPRGAANVTTARKHDEWIAQPRCTRWYEWLVILLLLAFAGGVRAGSVYKCEDSRGGIAYQDLPCAETQRERLLELEPAPAYQPSPQYAIDNEARAMARSGHGVRRAAVEAAAFECRAADGAVFYRHSGCPHSLAPSAASGRSARGAGKSAGAPVSVSARRITREEACRAIHAAGAIGRAGHEHDDDVSTYERNLGRDPCR
jgi:hypothetical protein